MYKLIGVILLASFLAVESRYTIPLKLEKSESVANKTKENVDYRLPSTVKPESYDVGLKVYLDKNGEKSFTFDGVANIVIKVEKKTNVLTVHSQDLTIEEVTLVQSTNSSPKKLEVNYTYEPTSSTTNFLNVTKKDSSAFDVGTYTLGVKYIGILNDDLLGFYRSYYTNDEGETKWLAITQFEPVGARRAFPCFDEPGFKATFDLKLTYHKNYTSLFNTKSKSITSNADGTITAAFETTPKISAYLVAFAVSDFKSKTNAAKNFTVHARPNAIQNGDLAVNKGQELLRKLEIFTGIPFETKLGKMDQISVPQFSAGAMENWGLVTYREEYLLFDEETSSAADQQDIEEVIAHEFAHQWFGDLVSPKWWKYLWLNEGFATFFESYTTEEVDPSFRSIDQQVVKAIQTTAFNLDSSARTHPINQDVASPDEINDIFDSISYYKGGAVIRMMQHYLTTETFRKGLQAYLNKNEYQTANSDDLFASIQTVLNDKINISEVMDAWVNKEGYPIVTVTRDYENNKVNLKQERFFTYTATAEEQKDNLWQIPISIATESKPDFVNTSADVLLTKPNETVSVVSAGKDQWIIVNKQQTGFYRVNYDEQNWKLIIDYLNGPNKDKIHLLNRAQLLNDGLAFVQQDIIDLQTLLELISYLKTETDPVVWYPAQKIFKYLNSKLANTDYYSGFKEYALNVSAALIEFVGLEATEKDDHIKKINRNQVITMACYLGHSECLTKTQEKLVAWIEDEKKNPIPKDSKVAVLCRGLQNATQESWEQVFNKSKTSADTKEKQLLTTSLSCSNDNKILEWYLLYSLVNDNKEDLQKTITNVLGNEEVGVDVVLDFLGPNIFKLHWKLDDKKALIQLINKVGEKITTEAQLAKLQVIENLNVLVPDELVTEGISLAKINLQWLEKNNATLADHFGVKANAKNGIAAITSSVGLIASLLAILIYNNL